MPSEPSSGVPRPLSGDPLASARRLLVDDCGVPGREKRGGVTYCCCSNGVAGRDMGGRPRSLRCDGVRGTSSQGSGLRKSGAKAMAMFAMRMQYNIDVAYDVYCWANIDQDEGRLWLNVSLDESAGRRGGREAHMR